ncbi:MAG: hypothetical protein AAF975_05655, partial [Spirochaetota bacterium]
MNSKYRPQNLAGQFLSLPAAGRFVCLTLWSICLVLFPGNLQAKNILLEFLKVIDSSQIGTAESIPEAEKRKLTASDLNRNYELANCENLEQQAQLNEEEALNKYYETWYVKNKGPTFIEIGPCGNSDYVLITLYKKNKNKGYLVGVTSIMGNHGQSQTFSFYNMSNNYKLTGEIPPEDALQKLGLETPSHNDFLAPEQHFPPGFPPEKKSIVILFMNQDGTLGSEPLTWGYPAWKFRE